MKSLKAILLEPRDVKPGTGTPWSRMTARAFNAASLCDVVLYGKDVIRNRYGNVTGRPKPNTTRK